VPHSSTVEEDYVLIGGNGRFRLTFGRPAVWHCWPANRRYAHPSWAGQTRVPAPSHRFRCARQL